MPISLAHVSQLANPSVTMSEHLSVILCGRRRRWHETLALSSNHDTMTRFYFNVAKCFRCQTKVSQVRATHYIHIACSNAGRHLPLFQFWDSIDQGGPAIRQCQSID